ncbi:hypothetical protein AVEN_30405-1 [Araneus ventricosus]|uniref:Uncharacterized protein n=1 Tax=Araneus ventricosus TaxID=182803 RepID=A0A4Y2FLD0_ARAVE|nr:hypothetical protein AVEN_30405-1 [Araneus ventricosus]
MFGNQIGCYIWAVWEVTPDFSLELSQQILSFASSMGIVMQEDDTITQLATAFASDGFTMAHDYFLFPKLKEYLSGTRFSSEFVPDLFIDKYVFS